VDKLCRIKLVAGIELQWLSGRNTIHVDDEVVQFCCRVECHDLSFQTAFHLLSQQSKLAGEPSGCHFDSNQELGEVIVVTVIVSVAIELIDGMG
jgi:hypothetical protein